RVTVKLSRRRSDREDRRPSQPLPRLPPELLLADDLGLFGHVRSPRSASESPQRSNATSELLPPAGALRHFLVVVDQSVDVPARVVARHRALDKRGRRLAVARDNSPDVA